jgi:hypothetical protein
MVFDLDKADQGDWFAFFDSEFDQATGEIAYKSPEEGAAEFCIRTMVPFFEERRRARKREAKMVVNPVSRQMERVVYFEDLTPEQEQQEAEDAWDYAITGVRGAKGSDGEEIQATRENKLKLIRIPKFRRYIERVFQILSGEAAKAEEARIKN